MCCSESDPLLGTDQILGEGDEVTISADVSRCWQIEGGNEPEI